MGLLTWPVLIMKNAQTFSHKVFELALLSDYEHIASFFNRLLHSFYPQRRNIFRQLRALRQAQIRLDMEAQIYEVDSRQSAYVVKLLKAEEELLEMIVAGKGIRTCTATNWLLVSNRYIPVKLSEEKGNLAKMLLLFCNGVMWTSIYARRACTWFFNLKSCQGLHRKI